MRINDVIRDAPTEATVYFLLTAYIEAVWRERGDTDVLATVAKLPLSGVDDVEARYNVLAAEAGRSRSQDASDGDVINESVDVFGAAAWRLRRLHGEGA